MSCEICGRGACQRSFHSFEAQERYDKAKEFDGNIRAIADALDSRDSEISELKAENTHLRERIEKLEAECEFVKAQKESLQRTAEFAVSLAEEFERAVASREPVSGMQVTPTGDFISAAQLPSVLKRMEWWAREIRASLGKERGR